MNPESLTYVFYDVWAQLWEPHKCDLRRNKEPETTCLNWNTLAVIDSTTDKKEVSLSDQRQRGICFVYIIHCLSGMCGGCVKTFDTEEVLYAKVPQTYPQLQRPVVKAVLHYASS